MDISSSVLSTMFSTNSLPVINYYNQFYLNTIYMCKLILLVYVGPSLAFVGLSRVFAGRHRLL
jgi:hypothetical protein